jgi:hypothetical protein
VTVSLPLVPDIVPLDVKPVPLAVHTRDTDVALLEFQVTVALCPAVIVAGFLDTLSVGGTNAGLTVIATSLLSPSTFALLVARRRSLWVAPADKLTILSILVRSGES